MANEHIVLKVTALFLILVSPSATGFGVGTDLTRGNGCAESERRALLALKADIYQPPPPHNWLSSWRDGTDCCSWRGVGCDDTTGHVIKLDLRYPYALPMPFTYDEYNDNLVSGPSKLNSSSLLGLMHLRHLDLSMNNFSGQPIPESLGSLEKLVYLNLNNAMLSGTIPPHLGNLSSLRFLDLSYNDLSVDKGLDWVSRMASLEYLDMSMANLSKTRGNWIHDINMLPSLSVLLLSGSELTHIPSTLPHVNLTSLTMLDLSQNSFDSPMPHWLQSLTHLVHLDFTDSSITGDMMTLESLSKLENLALYGNTITGEIPKMLGNLTDMTYLDLSFNTITGEIPNNMRNLSKLEYLRLGFNIIGGTIPELGCLCKLNTLDLADNMITGEITSLVEGLSRCGGGSDLQFLTLDYNALNGTIPVRLGQLSKLQQLDLSSNSFVGNLTEAHFSNLTDLEILDFSYNHFDLIFSQNWIPPFNSRTIGLCSCHLGPKFPKWLWTQTRMLDLCISDAGISDTIPSWFWDMDLSYLNASYNHLSGSIPSFYFHNMTSLQVIDLSKNNLDGRLPSFPRIRSRLIVLDLSSNNFSSHIPESFGYLVHLQSLHLRNNGLIGNIPWSLHNCSQLVVLDLGENKLSGNIPAWTGESFSSLRVLRLRSNFFNGNIPSQISLLTKLQVLDLAHNNFSGILSPSFWEFRSMVVAKNVNKPMLSDSAIYYENIEITLKGQEYVYTNELSLVISIDLSSNSLYGEIAQELTKLHGLVSLNLSRNYFSGEIPDNIGVMGNLESLDLSLNNFSGSIPRSISDLNFLSHLNLSYNKLSGKIPSGDQLQTLDDPSIYIGNPYLCGWPLPNCTVDAPSQGAPHEGGIEEKRDQNYFIWLYASIAVGFVMGFWSIIGTLMIKLSLRIAYIRLIDMVCDWAYAKLAAIVAKLKV